MQKNILTTFEIISGGQTGVDRAALDIAIKLKISHGGWCPKDRLAELGEIIPKKYLLRETNSREFCVRTKLNVKDSDATLILVPNVSSITGGTKFTIDEAKAQNKPYLIVDLSKDVKIDEIIKWIYANNIKTLNIAGPRESKNPGIYDLSFDLLEQVFLVFLQETD